MIKLKQAFAFLFITFLFLGCKEKGSDKRDLINSSFKRELIGRQLGKSNFYLSIPNDYIIEISEGPDFYVYYFYPKDTLIKPGFSGGLYFGNQPGFFPPKNDSCRKENLKSKILNQDADFTVYNCNQDYFIQTIVDIKKVQGWNELIHAFGHANSKAELDKLSIILTTLTFKK